MSTPLTAERIGDTQLRVRRRFAAPPSQVWDAHWKPELITQWMLGPDGWTMPVCEIRPEVGAPIRFRWEDGDGNGFGLTGEVKEVEAPRRSVHVEHFDIPGATPSVCETLFEPDGDGTRLQLTITFESEEAREAAMSTGMTDGMELSYQRLESL